MNKKVIATIVFAAAAAGIINYSSSESSPANGIEPAKVQQRTPSTHTDVSAQSSEYVQTERAAEMRSGQKAHDHGVGMNERTDTQSGKAAPRIPSSTHISTPGRGSMTGHSDFEKFARSLTPEQWAAMDAAADRLKTLAENQAPIEEIAAAMANYKTAAGPQGIPGIDIDGVISSLQSTALMMRKSEELRKWVDQYESKKNSASKEEMSQITEKIRGLQKEMAIQSRVPG